METESLHSQIVMFSNDQLSENAAPVCPFRRVADRSNRRDSHIEEQRHKYWAFRTQQGSVPFWPSE